MLKMVCLMASMLMVHVSYSMELVGLLRAFGKCLPACEYPYYDVEPIAVNAGAVVKTFDGYRWKIGHDLEIGGYEFKSYNGRKAAIILGTVNVNYNRKSVAQSEVLVNGKYYSYCPTENGNPWTFVNGSHSKTISAQEKFGGKGV